MKFLRTLSPLACEPEHDFLFEPTQPAFTWSKLTIETLEQWRCFSSFFVNFEHISHLPSSVSIVNFGHVIADWEGILLKKILLKELSTDLHYNLNLRTLFFRCFLLAQLLAAR